MFECEDLNDSSEKVTHCYKISDLKLINFENSVELSHRNNFEIRIGSRLPNVYPHESILYTSPAILSYLDKLTDKKPRSTKSKIDFVDAIAKIFDKGKTIEVNPFKEDVYSCGLIMLKTMYLLTDQLLQQVKDKLVHCQSSQQVEDVIEGIDNAEALKDRYPKYDTLLKLLKHCLNPDSRERPSFNVLMILMSDIKNNRLSVLDNSCDLSTFDAFNVTSLSDGELGCIPVSLFTPMKEQIEENVDDGNRKFTKAEINEIFKTTYHDLEKLRMKLLEEAIDEESKDDQLGSNKSEIRQLMVNHLLNEFSQ